MSPAVFELASAILTLLIEELGKDDPKVVAASLRIADYVKTLFAAASADPEQAPTSVQASDVTTLVASLKQEILSEADSAAEVTRVQQSTNESTTLPPKNEPSK